MSFCSRQARQWSHAQMRRYAVLTPLFAEFSDERLEGLLRKVDGDWGPPPDKAMAGVWLDALLRFTKRYTEDVEDQEAEEFLVMLIDDLETTPEGRWVLRHVICASASVLLSDRRERRDPGYIGLRRGARLSSRFMRRWGHLPRRGMHRHPVARREIARELYGHRGRAPRPASNTRTPGSRRSRPQATRGPPDDDDPHEQPDHVDPAHGPPSGVPACR